MTPPLKSIAACILLALIAPAAISQQPRTIIFLDPAHGGPDTGAHLPNDLLEKDLTLTFATRLRSTLATAGFALVSTRDSDPTVLFTTDQRAEIANHAHPAACLILHATSSGTGIHIITSALTPLDNDNPRAIPWDTAQAASIPQSLLLANELGLALNRAKLPVILSRASMRPLNSLTCPAVAVEIAPPGPSIPVSDPAWQQRIIQAIADGLAHWRSQIVAPGASAPAGAAK